MAKFRQGDLVLQSDQSITQGGVPIVNANGVAKFNSLELASGQSVTGISSDSTSSDIDQLMTSSAIQTLVGSGGGGGTSGSSGTSGIAGTSGSSGTSGIGGTSGSSGTSGIGGTSGSSGTSGTAGTSGSSGTSGISGSSGSSGTSGTSGTSSVTSTGTDTAVAIYDGTSAIQASLVTIDELGNITIPIPPTTDFQVANKKYVDDAGEVNPGTDNTIARYDSTAAIQDSLVSIDDFGNMSGVNNFDASGDVNIVIDSTTSLFIDIGDVTPGTNATLAPDEDNTISLNIGSVSNAWQDVSVYAGTSLGLYVADSTSAAIAIDNTQVAIFKELPITPSEAPTTDYQVANKKYVDDTALAQVDAGIAAAIGVGVDERIAIYDGTSSIQNSLVSIDVSGNISQVDDTHHYIGNDTDLDIYHTGAYGGVHNNTGGLYIDAASGEAIIFRISATLAVTIASNQVVTFTELPVTPSEAPTTDYQVANKKYVDDAALWDSTPDVNQTGSGDTTIMTVDSTATVFGTALYIAPSGNLEEADASDSTSVPCIALALEAGGGEKEVLLGGFIRNDSWNWTDIGKPVYLSTTIGGLTQTAPSVSGEQVQIVGIAKSADIVYFIPDLTVVEIA